MAEAEPLFREALERRQRRLGAHADTAESLNNLGTFLTEARRFDESERLLREASIVESRALSLPPEYEVSGRLLSGGAYCSQVERAARARSQC